MDLESELKKYFSPCEWGELSDSERNVAINIFKNYSLLQNLGIDIPKPSFMKKKRKLQQGDSGSGSDRPWESGKHLKLKEKSPKSSSRAKTRQRDAVDTIKEPPFLKRKRAKLNAPLIDANEEIKQQKTDKSKLETATVLTRQLKDLSAGVKIELVQAFKVCDQSSSEDSSDTDQDFPGFSSSQQSFKHLLSYSDERGVFVPLGVSKPEENYKSVKRYPYQTKEHKNYYEEPVPEDGDYVYRAFSCGYCSTSFSSLLYLDRHSKFCREKLWIATVGSSVQGFIPVADTSAMPGLVTKSETTQHGYNERAAVGLPITQIHKHPQ